jgi:hypothetical protein
MSIDTFKTICQGALGAVTFGAYHQFTTNKIMELNNEKIEIQHKQDIQMLKTEHRKEMNELNEKYKQLEKNMEALNRRWF